MAAENKEGYERRMTVVRDLIRGFGLEGKEITPVEWVENCPFPFNNFIYKVALSSPATAEHFTGAVQGQPREQLPCTESPPSEGVSTVIVRLSNPRALGLNNAHRVENEAAAMHLVRGAVAQLGPRYVGIVPAVYAWKAATGPNPVDETGFGWTVMEYLTGSPLDAQFKNFDMAEKKPVILEIAAIFSAIQGVKLPPGVDRFGGLTINDDGRIVSGQATLQELPGGPWEAYEEVWKHQIRCQLKDADGSELIDGWRANGVRERIERFISQLGDVIRDAGVDTTKLVLVHTDFTMNNMLWDDEQNRITGVFDFDWAGVTHPAHEFFTSLHDLHGTTTDRGPEKIRQAIMSGDFSASADAGEEENADAWEIAKTWDGAVKQCGGIRPSDISGMQTLEKLRTLTDLICPFHLGVPAMLKRKTAEQNAKARADTEKAIDEILSEWGA